MRKGAARECDSSNREGRGVDRTAGDDPVPKVPGECERDDARKSPEDFASRSFDVDEEQPRRYIHQREKLGSRAEAPGGAEDEPVVSSPRVDGDRSPIGR